MTGLVAKTTIFRAFLSPDFFAVFSASPLKTTMRNRAVQRTARDSRGAARICVVIVLANNPRAGMIGGRFGFSGGTRHMRELLGVRKRLFLADFCDLGCDSCYGVFGT